MSIKKAAEQYYQRIKEQFDILYPKDTEKIADQCRLQEILHLSKEFCLKKQEYLLLTLYIDRLVCRWDDMHKDKIPNRRHSFVIVNRSSLYMYDLEKFHGMLALMFDYESAPDNRIIVIAVNDDLTIHQNLNGILHEVGHYIGCRQRRNHQPNRIHFFVDLALQSFLREVFLNTCSHLLHEGEVSYAILTDPTYHPEKQQTMREIIVCLSDNKLYNWLYQTLISDVNHLLEDHRNNEIYLYGYKKAIAEAINLSFKHLFDSNDLRNKLQKQVCASVKKHGFSDNINNQINKSIYRVINMQTSESSKEVTSKDFGTNAGNLLMEVAADVFMVRSMDMGPMYLRNMLFSFQDQCADWKNHIEEKLLNDTGERARLVCLQAACMNFTTPHATDSVLPKITLFINKWLKNSRKLPPQYDQLLCISNKLNEILDHTPKVSYNNMHRTYDIEGLDKSCNLINHANQLRILNPCVTLGEYVRLIMQDKRYSDFFDADENLNTVRHLRAFSKKPCWLLYLEAVTLKDWNFT